MTKDQEEIYKDLSPIQKQYFDIQLKYPTAIVCFEMGKFYEILEKDILGGHAKKAAQIADLVLTKKNKSLDTSPFMVGFPQHVAESYFKDFVKAGETVVVVSQKKRGTKKDNNKNVERHVEKILSPGVVIDNFLKEELANYFCSIFSKDLENYGVALIDISTGEVRITELDKFEIEEFIFKINPAEFVITADEINFKLPENKIIHKYPYGKGVKNLDDCGFILEKLYDLKNPTSNPKFNLSTLELEFWKFGALALANAINHLSSTEENVLLLKKMARPKSLGVKDYLNMPMNGYMSLEVFTQQNNPENTQGTLIHAIDRCRSALGRRKLREWLQYPLLDITEINARYNKVDNFIKKDDFLPELSNIFDITRISRRMNMSRILPHEILYFYNSIQTYVDICDKEIIDYDKDLHIKAKTLLFNIEKNINLEKAELATRTLRPFNNFMKGEPFNAIEEKYEDWKVLHLAVKAFMEILGNCFSDSDGTKKLKLEKTKETFKIETLKSNASKTPDEKVFFTQIDNKINKSEFLASCEEEGLDVEESDETQILSFLRGKSLRGMALKNFTNGTLSIKPKLKASNCEIIGDSWKELSKLYFTKEEEFLNALAAQWESYQKSIIDEFSEEIFDIGNALGEFDVLSNFAKISKERSYSRPKLEDSETPFVNFKKCRHPVVEISKDLKEGYTPNDIIMNKDQNTLVLYGANSGGKSTLLKSTAINILLAQVGCFIAANEGSSLSIFENILTRMSTFDSLSEGKSTFVVEMLELSNALKYVKQKSLFLFDEIGRGTSATDGESIAFGVLNFLETSNENKSLTLFATHYHNLYDSIKVFKKTRVAHIECFTHNQDLVFNRILKDGPGSGSYGLEVASSCGLPKEVMRLASNYNKDYSKLKRSRYNKKIQSSLCEYCNKNPAQETHHLQEQKQGTVKEIEIHGVKRSINDKENLLYLCATCHQKITLGELTITEKRNTTSNSSYLKVEKKKNEENNE